jgi:hypothetical protein
LYGEKIDGTSIYIAQWQYKRARKRNRQTSVRLYFRAYKNNTIETESPVRSFVDGIIAIKTERNGMRKFFVICDTLNNYGGDQAWYTEPTLFTGVRGWNSGKGRIMNISGCGHQAVDLLQ